MRLWMAPAGLHIEPGQTGDASALAKLHAEGFFRGWPTSDFVSYLSDPDVTPAYIACGAKRAVSGFVLLRLAADEAEILTIAVARKARGKGIASALLRAVLTDLRTTAARRLLLEVDSENAAALALYKAFGFFQIGQRKAYYPKPDGSAATANVLQLDLI